MEWKKNEQLTTIREDWKGNPVADGRFTYLDEPFYPSGSKLLQWFFRPNPQRREKVADTWRPDVKPIGDSPASLQGDFICWLGHESFLIQIAGRRLILDPVLFDLPFLSRKVPLPYALEELGQVDYILLSHDHRDHCDKKSLQAVWRKCRPAKVLTGLNMHTVLSPWLLGLEVEEASWYQVYRTGPELEIIYLPARHWCRRGVFDFNRVLWGSFLIRSREWSIYFGADSGYASHFAEIGKLFPDIDLALIGIGAYKPGFMMKEIHTSPKEAAQAFDDLGARHMLPMHFGTYDLSDEPISEPYHHIQRIFVEARRDNRLQLPAVGEILWREDML